MSVLSHLEPKEVFYYFEEICGIPHGSGNTKRIADYCEQFAARRGLQHSRDAHDNVTLVKAAAAGAGGEWQGVGGGPGGAGA